MVHRTGITALLRCSVACSSHSIAFHTQLGIFRSSCKAKVRELGSPIFSEHDIGGFHVSVNHPLPVSKSQGSCQASDNIAKVIVFQNTVSRHKVMKGFAFHIFHHQKMTYFIFSTIVNRTNILVVQLSNRFRFTQETLDSSFACLEYPFNGNLSTTQTRFIVSRKKNGSHATSTQLGDDFIPIPN